MTDARHLIFFIQFLPMETERDCETADRLTEIGSILAVGLMRALSRKSSEIPAETGESSLDISPSQSGHATRRSREKENDG